MYPIRRQVAFWLGIVQEIYRRPKPSVFVLLRHLTLFALVFTLRILSKWLERLRYRLHNRPYERLELRGETQSFQLQSQLLALPAEIRLIIWKNVMTDHRIVLFRRNGRITYNCLTTEYPEPISNITREKIKNLEDGVVCPSRCEKIKFLAILQTCQMMYLETIDLLYTTNTFMFLQNTVFSDFIDSPDLVSSVNLSKIRSLHIHFQFGESVDYFSDDPEVYVNSNFDHIFNKIPPLLPNIRDLSVFIQGPLIGHMIYSYIVSRITSVCHKTGSLNHVVIRMPRHSHGRPRPRWSTYWAAVKRSIHRILANPDIPFQIVQPVSENRPLGGLKHDEKTRYDCSWRLGTLYIKDDGNLEERRTVNYAVFTEENSNSSEP